ncbi:MAG TPA: TRAP transporter large permease subunit, partial [Myxococcales bacterium]|nr:TRAP transporter large permease subunit [Myxococcales bacterium]
MQFVVLLLAVVGLPLFVVIALLALFSYQGLDWPISSLFNDIDELADKAHLLPIPLFTFAGFLLARSKAPDRLVRLADAILGSAPGGLAIVSVCACTFFTTFTGASGVTIIALGGLLYPVLMKRNYPEQFSLGLLTSSGSLGLLFFPALPVFIFAVVYGFATNSSDVTPEGLFLAGLFPGILLTLVLCGYAAYVGNKHGIERTTFSFQELREAFRGAIWEAMLPGLLMGMLLSGLCSLNEIATLTVVYLMIVEMVIHRDIHPWKDLPRLVAESMVLVGAIILIMTMIMPTKDVLEDGQIPDKILEYFSQFITSKMAFLLVLNVFLLVVGCLMDIFSAIVAVLPLLIPFAVKFDVDPLHLGVIFLVNLEIGYLTPPVGINLFISSFQFRKPVLTVYRSVLPFIALLFATLMIITYVPALSTWLPEQFIEKSVGAEEVLDEEDSAEDMLEEYGAEENLEPESGGNLDESGGNLDDDDGNLDESGGKWN